MKTIQLFIRNVRRVLAGSRSDFVTKEIFSLHSLTFNRTIFAIRFFYLCLFCYSLTDLYSNTESLIVRPMDQPKWPLDFLNWPANKELAVRLFQNLFLIGSGLCMFFPLSRWMRATVFLSLLYVVAFYNSDGHHSHFMHLMMYPSFFLAFLPSIKSPSRASRKEKHLTILGFWGGQLGICIAYQMAGYSKITEILRCLVQEGTDGCQVGTYIMTSMAAKEYIQYQWPTFTGELLYDFPILGAVMYYTVIWIHNISIIFPFRLHLHRFFLCYRAFFHFGTLILFGISFSASILAVVSMFAFSPFARPVKLKKLLRSLPPLGVVIK